MSAVTDRRAGLRVGEIASGLESGAGQRRPVRPRGRLRERSVPRPAPPVDGTPVGTNAGYVRWLVGQSMLADAATIAGQFSGVGTMWQNRYAKPDPRAAIEVASVWISMYPTSLITRPGCGFLATLADESLWQAFERIGIDAVHSGPVKRAGGLHGWSRTPTVDGHFDRVSTEIDSAFGTESDFRRMCEVAAAHGGTVIDDIVPGHTGKGADFRLAEMKVGDYPGIYHMVEIPREDWHLLPEVPEHADAVNLDEETEERLRTAGYIVGRLQRVIFYEPGVKETNWSATGEAIGQDGVARRWVYLHYFKQGQPSINWLDPSFASMRLVIGDALHSLADLGSGGLRFDANGFLGVEPADPPEPAWSEGHPLSESVNALLAGMVRKLGGFSFQELNLSIDDIAQMSRSGADLSYDFINRPAYQHALATGDTEFLRLTLAAGRELGVDPACLVHALQNHDELTYELIHFGTRHAGDGFRFRGRTYTGAELASTIRADLVSRLTGPAAPYNLIFTTNGIASTTVTVVAASLGIRDLAAIGPDEVERIKRAHLLLAMFNALQPGVFALSGWDLCGALTLDPADVAHLLADGDTRWIQRGGYDLMGYGPDTDRSASGMPRTTALYGDLPSQLADPESFASRLSAIIAVRRLYGIGVSDQIDVPEADDPALLAMLHRLPDQRLQATVLNFGQQLVPARVRSRHLPAGWRVTDLMDGRAAGTVAPDSTITLEPLAGHEGRALLIEPC